MNAHTLPWIDLCPSLLKRPCNRSCRHGYRGQTDLFLCSKFQVFQTLLQLQRFYGANVSKLFWLLFLMYFADRHTSLPQMQSYEKWARFFQSRFLQLLLFSKYAFYVKHKLTLQRTWLFALRWKKLLAVML